MQTNAQPDTVSLLRQALKNSQLSKLFHVEIVAQKTDFPSFTHHVTNIRVERDNEGQAKQLTAQIDAGILGYLTINYRKEVERKFVERHGRPDVAVFFDAGNFTPLGTLYYVLEDGGVMGEYRLHRGVAIW